MKTSKQPFVAFGLLLAAFFVGFGEVRGQVFSQNFNSSTTLADYISATPTTGQFNGVAALGTNTVSTATNALVFTRGNNTSYFARTTDFSPTPTFISYSFDLTTSSSAISDNVARLYIGDSFNNDHSEQNSFGRFSIDFRNTNNFRITSLDNAINTSSVNFSGTQRITWMINNSGSSQQYLSPACTIETLNNDQMDLWVGSTRVFSGMSPQTATQNLTDIKFIFNHGTGSITIDNILIENVPSISITPLPAGTYEINASGVNTLGGGETVYTSLTNGCGLFTQINANGLAGNITVRITSDLTETGSYALNEWTGGHTLTVTPDGTTMRTVSGNVNNANGMIGLNGADYVVFDGREPTATGVVALANRYLTFRNSNTGGPTFHLRSDASNNTLRYCIIEGRDNNGNRGVVMFGDGTTTGNDDNLVEYCDVKDAAGNRPNNCVYASSSTGTNDNIQLLNNRIFDFLMSIHLVA